MKTGGTIIFVVSLSILLLGCVDSGTQPFDPFATLPTEYVNVPDQPINTRIFYSFLEHIEREGRSVSLTFTTERIYGSGGYQIVSRIKQTGSHFIVYLDSIQAPEFGIAIPLPATARFQLGPLRNDLYSFEIIINGRTIVALLSVNDTSFLTRVQPNNCVKNSRPRLLRVPLDVIWGQAESFTPALYQMFLDSLVALGASVPHLPAGEYFYFTANTDGSSRISSALGRAHGRHFLYRFSPDTSLTRSLVKRFAKRHGDSIYVALFGGRGEMYFTTVLKLEPE